ncbi:hypothetical protein D9758_002813 [Tetrapyrgos nigripes]|uniref:DASH complex subunit DUO1 n=1 Tax=Tetrapyrgos nigripes TaxID=182062 RepID=A0A8H5LTC5_9AGAR|nr:hypothetical protein D9758_002813 [Tetrapyrgos nigripes]
MDHNDSVDLQAADEHLLSESPDLPSESSHSYSNANDDFSISELQVSTPPKPFSLLARPPSPTTPTPQENAGEDDAVDEEEQDRTVRKSTRTREEDLQSDLFVLKKINGAFMEFNDVLDNVGSANERISEQLEETEKLLDKYVKMLEKSEEYARLIFDEEWEGAQIDDAILEREQREAIERRRREEEERALAAQRERERLEKEERERQQRLEQERVEREKKEKLTTRGRGSGVRGVRGTRASMRGMRGASGVGRGDSGTTTSTTGGRGTTRIARGSSIRGS